MTRFAVVAVVALLVAGCQSNAERAAVNQGKCSGYGFTPGTDAYANCMKDLDIEQDRVRREYERRNDEMLRDASEHMSKLKI